MRLMLLLLLMPLSSHADVWTIHANMLVTFAVELDVDPHYRVEGTFTTDASGVPQTWDIFGASISQPITSAYRLTNDPCTVPGNPFSGCSAELRDGRFVFRNWFGGRAIDEFSFVASNGVLTAANLSGYYQSLELIDGAITHAPEPGMYALLSLGLLGLYARLKRA
ncbi:MAG: PEP-CTERM sorting domain-containing protein [Betaproteobacteria bacterium]